ncbi:ABC transporter permease [Acidobacteriota bacterium]
MKRVKAVFRKEFCHILRDPASLSIVMIMPVLMIFIFGQALNFDLKNISTGVLNLSGGQMSRSLVKTFANTDEFDLRDLSRETAPLDAAEELIRLGEIKQVLIIPSDFDGKIQNSLTAEVDLVIDGSDSNTANRIYQYDEILLLNFASSVSSIDRLLRISTKVYFNPTSKSAYFFIPGVIAIILLMVSALLTSLSISRERETGSIDLIYISPLKSSEIILGKTAPYIFVALTDGLLILLFARLLFGIPFRGNILVLLIFSLLYIFSGLALGILVSTAARSQIKAMFIAILATLLPSLLLSGFIFPLDSMAPVLQFISRLIPATYFLKIIRGVAIKGADFRPFLNEGLALVVFSSVLIAAASAKFRLGRKKAK